MQCSIDWSLARALVFALALGPICAMAQSADQPKPMALRGIMLQLDSDMNAVNGAISQKDWQTVAELAPRIANHAEPPILEKVKILAWLNIDAPKFRGFDVKAKDDAAAMGDAAKKGDGQAVVADYAKIQQSCLGCHEQFRQKFIDHFYGG